MNRFFADGIFETLGELIVISDIYIQKIKWIQSRILGMG